MKRTILLRLFTTILAALAPSMSAATQRGMAADRPNIVFVLTDDQRADGYRASGNELVETPNLDRIAAEGTRFTNAFVTLAICSPSRAACLTGRYGSANGVTSVGKTRSTRVKQPSQTHSGKPVTRRG